MENLAYNVEQMKSRLPGNCRLMPAVKANAYGHGMIPVAKALNKLGIRDFCVAAAKEGAELRKAGIEGEILVLGYTHPEAFPLLLKYDLTQTVVDASYARLLAGYGKKFKVHISVDTGMRRLGERCEHLSSILSFWEYQNLAITGLYSHLCVADSLSPMDIQFTLMQFQRFDTIIDALRQKGINGFATHIQSSYGFLNYPEFHYDYIRPGIALYEISDAAPMDEVVFIGRSSFTQDDQTFSDEIKAEELALQGQTISNEILSCLGERLDRVVL